MSVDLVVVAGELHHYWTAKELHHYWSRQYTRVRYYFINHRGD
ncbi:MAG: hypothetical protein WBA77_14925 [Microcoleaceae cyanobacterium]